MLIGTSGKGGTFTKEVLEEISSYQDVSSIILIFLVLHEQPSGSICNLGKDEFVHITLWLLLGVAFGDNFGISFKGPILHSV